MFGSKKQDNKKVSFDVQVESIPDEFYAGVNPVVKFKSVEKEIKNEVGIDVGKKNLERPQKIRPSSHASLANLLSSPKFLFLVVGLLFVVFLAVAGVYYWRSLSSSNVTNTNLKTEVTSTPLINNEQPAGELATTTEEVVTSTVTTTSENTVNLLEVPPTYPSVILGESVDTDNDGLTDVAEELFLTDLGTPDSDQDKYSDSHEIFNLYNPIGKEPRKLIDSGLVIDYANPVFEYRIYYPKNWAVGNVDADYRDILFSTITGENIEIRAIDKTSQDESFVQWFAKWAPDERFGDLKSFTTVFGDKGWQRSDELVYYFETPRHVYVVIYHTTDSTVANYKMVIKMVARSFRLPTTNEVWSQPIIEESSVTSEQNIVTSSEVPVISTSSF